MTHRKEIERLANSEDYTEVWLKRAGNWELATAVKWLPDSKYIVDDDLADVRKDWIDQGKPSMVMWHNSQSKWIDCDGSPEWLIGNKYKIKRDETAEAIEDIEFSLSQLQDELKELKDEISRTKAFS